MSHLWTFFPSWKVTFFSSQTICSFPLWILVMCLFKLPVIEVSYAHKVHLESFFTSWRDVICCFKVARIPNLESHTSHLYGLFPSWTEDICIFKWLFCVNCDWQTSHLNSFCLHEPMKYVYPNGPELRIENHICHTYMAFFLHE